MVSVCLPLMPSCNTTVLLGFSYLGRGVSLHGCSSKVQPLLLTLEEGYLLTAALPDLHCGIAPLGPPVPMQPRLLGRLAGYNPGGCKESDTTERLITSSREGPDRGGGG